MYKASISHHATQHNLISSNFFFFSLCLLHQLCTHHHKAVELFFMDKTINVNVMTYFLNFPQYDHSYISV